MKKILYVLVFILMAALVSAARVCVVVDYNNGNANSKCIDVADDANGYEVVEATGWDIEWKDWGILGHSLCKINGIGRDIDDCLGKIGDPYWNFNIVEDSKWSHALVGFDGAGDCLVHYCAKDNDIIGFTWGISGAKPDMLKIEEIKSYANGDKETLDEGEKIKDIKPESNLKFKVKVKNLYEEDIEIKDITITVTIKDIDDGDDLEEESDELDLDPGDSETGTIEFEIPLEVEDGDYDVVLTIKGKDSENVEYEKTLEYILEIEKEKHDIILKAELNNPVLKCSRTTSLEINLMNMGTNDEEVILKVMNSELELNKQLNFELSEDPFDDDNIYTASIPIEISEDQQAGIYPITIRADYGSKTEQKIVELEIQDCETVIEEKEPLKTEPEKTQKTTEKQETQEPETNKITTKAIEPKTNIPAIIGIIVIYSIVVIGGVYLALKIIKK